MNRDWYPNDHGEPYYQYEDEYKPPDSSHDDAPSSCALMFLVLVAVLFIIAMYGGRIVSSAGSHFPY